MLSVIVRTSGPRSVMRPASTDSVSRRLQRALGAGHADGRATGRGRNKDAAAAAAADAQAKQPASVRRRRTADEDAATL